MAESYYSLATNALDAAVGSFLAGGAQVLLTQMAVGDGGGSYYEPTKGQTVLKGEKWRGAAVVAADPGNPRRVTVTATIPSTVGGFSVREAGVFDSAGTLMVVSKQPLSDKVLPSSGAGKDMTIRIYLQVADAGAITITVDPSAQMVSQTEFQEHVQDTGAHVTTAKQQAWDAHMADGVKHLSATERAAWNSKAAVAVFGPLSLPASGWVGEEAPYTQTLSVEGMLATDRPRLGVLYSGTDAQMTGQSIMAGFLSRVDSGAGSCTVTCYLAKPTVDLSIQLEVVR